MKYLNPTNGEYFASNEESRKEWDEKFRKWEAEFQTIIPRLPKRFVKEFCKEYFHDSTLVEMGVEQVKTNDKFSYNLKLVLRDGYDNCLLHIIWLINIKNYNTRFNLFYDFHFDWIYCELIPVNEKTLSLEACFADQDMFYVEFKKLKYKKVKI